MYALDATDTDVALGYLDLTAKLNDISRHSVDRTKHAQPISVNNNVFCFESYCSEINHWSRTSD